MYSIKFRKIIDDCARKHDRAPRAGNPVPALNSFQDGTSCICTLNSPCELTKCWLVVVWKNRNA